MFPVPICRVVWASEIHTRRECRDNMCCIMCSRNVLTKCMYASFTCAAKRPPTRERGVLVSEMWKLNSATTVTTTTSAYVERAMCVCTCQYECVCVCVYIVNCMCMRKLRAFRQTWSAYCSHTNWCLSSPAASWESKAWSVANIFQIRIQDSVGHRFLTWLTTESRRITFK